MEFLILPISRVLLLAAAAKSGRSTLDTKKGYKTKTGSTSSLTLTLKAFLCFSPSLTPLGGGMCYTFHMHTV